MAFSIDDSPRRRLSRNNLVVPQFDAKAHGHRKRFYQFLGETYDSNPSNADDYSIHNYLLWYLQYDDAVPVYNEDGTCPAAAT